MRDSNPMLLRRMLALRQFPMFAATELAELAVIAENVVETRYRAGSIVAPAARRLSGLHLVLDGRIEAGRPWGPRQIFGALELFAGREPATAAVAAAETQTLHLSGPDLAELLEDNFGVMFSIVRELAARMLAVATPIARPVALPSTGGSLGLVERLIVLRQQTPFAGARLQGLAMLAHASEEITWSPGAVVARAGELASGSLLVLEGSLRELRRDGTGTSHELGPGHTIGALETLAGLGHVATIEALAPVRVLRSSGTAMLDVLEDHPDVGMSMIGAFARSLLDSPNGELAPAADPAN